MTGLAWKRVASGQVGPGQGDCGDCWRPKRVWAMILGLGLSPVSSLNDVHVYALLCCRQRTNAQTFKAAEAATTTSNQKEPHQPLRPTKVARSSGMVEPGGELVSKGDTAKMPASDGQLKGIRNYRLFRVTISTYFIHITLEYLIIKYY